MSIRLASSLIVHIKWYLEHADLKYRVEEQQKSSGRRVEDKIVLLIELTPLPFNHHKRDD